MSDKLVIDAEALLVFRRAHPRQEYPFGVICGACQAEWPCDTTVLLDEVERLRAALATITELDLEGDASLADAIAIADEALNPPPGVSAVTSLGPAGKSR